MVRTDELKSLMGAAVREGNDRVVFLFPGFLFFFVQF